MSVDVESELPMADYASAVRIADAQLNPEFAPPPKAPRSPAPTWRRTVGSLVSLLGVAICGFLVFELVFSDVVEQRAQTLLRPALADRMKAERVVSSTGTAAGEGQVQDSLSALGTGNSASDAAAAPSEPVAAAATETDQQRAFRKPALGTPLALISIPSLDVEHVVIEGSGQTQLTDGPGHYRGSALPGRVGNIVIAGRRATYGAPFQRIGELRRGDTVNLTTGVGVYRYKVAETFVVKPGERDVLGEDGTNRLTLITANSSYSARGRLVVVARLTGSEDAAPPVLQPAVVGEIPISELGLDRDTTAWAPVIIFSQALLLLWWLRRRLARSWSAASTWIVVAPISLAVGLLLMESLSRLLPSTL